MMCWASLSEDALSETFLADFPPVVSNRTRSFSHLVLAGVCGGRRAKQMSKCSWANFRVCGLGFSVLWTCLSYLQIVVQDKVSTPQQLYVGQDVPEPKVILSWFLWNPSTPSCVPLLPLLSLLCHLMFFSSSTHLSPSLHLWIPADGFPQQTAMEDVLGMQEE